MDYTNLFFIAARDKYTFNTVHGNATASDLFSLPLETTDSKRTSLDDIARSLDKELKESAGTSFVRKGKTSQKELILSNKLEIVKAIIAYKIAENEAKMDAQEKLANKEKIRTIIDRKKDIALENMTLEELTKMEQSL
jgi:hypothetical protein